MRTQAKPIGTNHVLLLCLIFGLAGLLLGTGLQRRVRPARQQIPDILQAHRFQVVDRDGTPRIELGVNPDGGAAIHLMGKNNRQVISLQVDARSNAALRLKDREERERATLSVTEEKGTVLALTGPEGQPIAALAVLPDGSEALSLLKLTRPSDGKPEGKLVKQGSALLLSSDGKAEMKFFGKTGKEHNFTP